MGHDHSHHDHRLFRGREAKRVALVGGLVNILLSVVKILVGFTSHSHSLLADGIHSISDLFSDALVWWAAHHASQGPDDEHPYGHGRFETAATLALGALLVLVAGGIIWDAFQRLFAPEQLWQPGIMAIYAAGFSVAANEALYWYTHRVGKQIRSDMLIANAWHHRSDAISSIIVLVGVGGTLLGVPWLDAVAALFVGMMVIKIGVDLGWRAMQELVDTSLDDEDVKKIRNVIGEVDGVMSIHMLRTRHQGHEASADVHVQVASCISVSEGHMISMVVEERVKGVVEEITDVTVHIDPEDDESAPPCAGLPLRQKAISALEAAWADLPCFDQHDKIQLHYLSGKIHVDLYLPLSCYEGQGQTASLESAFVKEVAQIDSIGPVRIYYSSQE